MFSTCRLSARVVGWLLLGLLVLAPVPAKSQQIPIPELALWEAHMLSYGQMHCYLGVLDHVYYDAERVYSQIADYTGNATWITCSQLAEQVYRDQYVIPNNGQVPGYWNFTTGMRMDYQRTSDAQSKATAILLSQKMWGDDGQSPEWSQTADYNREVAYAILAQINAEALGEPSRARRRVLVDFAYGHLDQWFVNFSWPGPWQQSPQTTIRLAPFMVGLTAHSLIRDWEETQDPRLIPALRRAADWMWANAWIPAAQGMWYEFPDQGQPCCQASSATPDLNLLIAPIYAFLYWQTGDIKYRDQGDQLFAGGVRLAYLGGGKQFNQNYWWSFDYVKWRLAASASNPLPSLTSLAPNGVAAGTAGVLLTVSGSNFVPNSVVRWNGTNRTTTFVSSTQLRATISASDLVLAGTAQVTAFNPAPGGGTSNALTFTISPSVAVAVVRVGTGAGTVASTPPGVSCGSICSAQFASGTSVMLTATPGANSTFGSWSGCDVVVATQCTIVATTTRTVTATFQAIPDTTPPTVSMTTPASGATTSGTITVTATATDNVGVVGVQFKLDGANLGAEDTVAPYSVSWNTRTVLNGTHTLRAVARDAAGNSTTSGAVTVTVNNDVTPPVISAAAASSISSSGATVTWTTNEVSDSQVEYGLTTAYGSSTPLDTSLVTAHSRTLSGLAASTVYHYRVKSRDAAGNLATSGDLTFTTLAPDINGGLVGYWKLDEGSGATAGDSSGNGSTGSLINGPSWAAGKVGKALSLDGVSQNVNIPHAPTLNTYPLTVALWMKTSATTGTYAIANKYAAGSLNGYQMFMNGGNLCAWYFRDAANYVWDGTGCTLTTPGPVDGLWHHVVFVVDASQGWLYVDGVLKTTRPWTGMPGATSTTQPLNLGVYPGSAGVPYFPGSLDDVRVYNRALSGQEVLLLYNWSSTFTDDPLPPLSTVIKAEHITELRAAIDSIRVARGLAPFAWTDPTLTPGVTGSKAAHLTELRTALNQAYQAAGRTLPTYTDPTVLAGQTVIKATHLNELRAAVRALP